MENLKSTADKENLKVANAVVSHLGDLQLYRRSLNVSNGDLFFICRKGTDKVLIIIPGKSEGFEGEFTSAGGFKIQICPLTHKNVGLIRSRFEFTRPQLIGKHNSYGFGDRLGNAGPAHLRAVEKTDFKPVLAQQSIRELERTNRTAEEVLDAASWAVFQEGYRDGFGADGDHLKTTKDIDLMVRAGYTMFTIDPSDYVLNDAVMMDEGELRENIEKLPWNVLGDKPEDFLNRFNASEIKLQNGFKMKISRNEVLAGMVKYGRVLAHTKKLADYLHDSYPDHAAELELSVDETDQPTTLFEHYLIASELGRMGVELVSLAPRFCGDFEKGIDFKGDLDQFREEYLQHLEIARNFGGYKLSIHSGSDKFSVYKVIGHLGEGAVHVKTAGTSYLEALRTIAEVNTGLFREILDFSKSRFLKDKKTYHISAELHKVPDSESLKDAELKLLLDDNDARQVLHVTYGSVLSSSSGFKERILNTLNSNEDIYEENLIHHFKKHLDPFDEMKQ